MKSKIFFLLMVGMSILFASNLNAQVRQGAFSVSPFIGEYVFDSDRQQIKDSLTYGAGLGYDISERWGIEGSFNLLNTESKIGGVDMDGYLGCLDLLYNLLTEEKFVPYVAIGAGSLSMKPKGGDSDSEVIGNYGLGMKYFLTDNVALRADARHVLSFPESNFLFTTGISFVFGGEKKARVVEQKAQPVAPKDTDGDGVYDDMDKCPNTPAGVKVDSVGCPLDTDKDGVFDYLDQCPNTPAGVKVDSVGCPLDTDKDGVFDYLDQCPNTPAGVKVDSVGCPLDTDKDGVLDYLDQCPDTPAGTKVDNKGCPLDMDEDGVFDDKDQCPNTPKGATIDQRGCWILKDLNFDTAKATIKADGVRVLDGVIDIMQANPSLRIEIQGHTDNKGAAAYNKKLSTKRAQAVVDYLVNKGIDKERLSAAGYGFDKPAASNDTEEGRTENRRVELTPIQ